MAGRRVNTNNTNNSNSNTVLASNPPSSSSATTVSNTTPSNNNKTSGTTTANGRRNNYHHTHATNTSLQFNPRLIFSQIIALQSFHYLTLCVIVQLNHYLFSTSITIDRIFTTKYLAIWSSEGWIDNSAVLLSSLTGSVLLAIIVEKSKKCLDFSVTLFFIHFVACSVYDGIPKSWDWWIVHLLGTIIMIIFGEYLCSLRE